MAYGGSIKLTGETEYRKALGRITDGLKEVAGQMKIVSNSFDANDKSASALSAKQDVLTKKLELQAQKVATLTKQYEVLTEQYGEQSRKHQELVDRYNNEKNKLGELEKTLGTTSKEYQDQKTKVEDLYKEVQNSTKAQDANEKSMSKMRQEIYNAQADMAGTEKALDSLGNEVEDSGKKADEAGKGGWTVFKGILANLSTEVIKGAINGIKKLSGAMINMGKQAYANFGEYEQLVGGVETLFGDSADKLMEYAKNAYATAGISSNEYMDTVTKFSASLLQSLSGDTEKAVEIADMALQDMSDNANKMGTDMSSIQNAYQGFAKQNYTMLDNLNIMGAYVA